MKLSCIIIEDEPLARERVVEYTGRIAAKPYRPV